MRILELENLGPISAGWLQAIGIRTKEDLKNIGSIKAFCKLHGFNASLNLLYALETALRDAHWNALSPPVKAKLKQIARAIR